MRQFLSLAVVLGLGLAYPAWAQQTGDANRNYVINGSGSNGTSVVQSTIGVPGTLTNSYSTLDPNSPVLWAAATSSTIGWLTTATNSVDIGPGGLITLGFGLDPSSILNLFFFTNQTGAFNLTLNAPAGLAGTNLYFAMAHITPAAPDGFYVSQTHNVAYSLDPNLPSGNATCNPLGTPLVLTDDSFAAINLGFSYTFYGTTYSSAFVGSNGYVTFVSGQTSLSESVSGILSGPPRISMWWDDLNPANGGSVRFFTDNAATFEVCFAGVPEYFATGANSFRLTASSAGLLTIDYGAMSSVDGLVGLSPGNNLDPVGTAMNMSISPNSINPGAAVYELFTAALPNDLAGFLVQFLMDGAGNPITQL